MVEIEEVRNKKCKAYSNIILNPLYNLPNICHGLTIKMVFQDDEKRIMKDISCILSLDLYFLENFEGIIEITPIEAKITRSAFDLGLMKPCLIFNVNDQIKRTLIVKEGSINPNWEEFATKKKHEFRIESKDMSTNMFEN